MMSKSLPRLEPMTIGMILDTTVRLYLQNAGLVIVITTLAFLPNLLFQVLFTLFTAAQAQRDTLPIIFGLLASALWLLIAHPLSLGAATYAISERYLQRPTSAKAALKAAAKRYGTLLWAQITVGLIIMGGVCLFIIPGIIFTLAYSVVTPTVMLEAGSARESRRRSWDLTAGYRRKVAMVMLVVWVLIFIVTSAVGAILPWLFDEASLTGQVTMEIIEQLVSYVVFPFYTLPSVLLYYDLRIRKEGFDLEMLSQALTRV